MLAKCVVAAVVLLAAGGNTCEVRAAGGSAVRLSTEADGPHQLPKDLPRLLHAVTRQARLRDKDAIPVALEFHELDAPNPRMRGPEVRISFLLPSSGFGLLATVTLEGLRLSPVNQSVRWGTTSLPPLFIDLPAATRIAREHGMRSPEGGKPEGLEPIGQDACARMDRGQQDGQRRVGRNHQLRCHRIHRALQHRLAASGGGITPADAERADIEG
jgi:hypothetical protein